MGKGGQKSETLQQAPTRKTKAAVDHHQNNRILRQCPPGIAQQPLHQAIAVPTATQNRVTKTMSVVPPLGKQLKQKKSNSQAQHHLPALDFFCANFFVRVQLTSLLLISPGLWGSRERQKGAVSTFEHGHVTATYTASCYGNRQALIS